MSNFAKNKINLFYQDNQKEILKKVNHYFQKDMWINGKILNKLEESLIKFNRLSGVIKGCNSGSDALKLSFLLDKKKNKDIYITTPYSYIASSSVAKFLNKKIIYIDVNSKNFLMDLDKLEKFLNNCDKNIKKRIAGIIYVELFGYTGDLIRLKKIAKINSLSLIGDCAQSFGTKFNNKISLAYYDYGALSFYPTKILSCYGDGGAIYIKNKKLSKNIDPIKNNGHDSKNKSYCRMLGINSRLDSIQGFILNLKLKKFKLNLDKRKRVYKRLTKHIKYKNIFPKFESKINQNNYLFPIYISPQKMNSFKKYMQKNGVETKNFYTLLLSENRVLKPIINNKLINSIKCKNSLVCLPCHDKLTNSDVNNIIKHVNIFFDKK